VGRIAVRGELSLLRSTASVMSDAVVRYVCVARLDGVDRFFLWESGGDVPDRVVLDDAGLLRVFPSERVARDAPSAEGYETSTEGPSVYDLDAIEAWCKSSAAVLDYSQLLDAWNLFGDMPQGENLFAGADTRANAVYDKLFRGWHLPAMTPPGEHDVPSWSASETAALKQLLLLGLAELRARLR
jgi:hypothetical protein